MSDLQLFADNEKLIISDRIRNYIFYDRIITKFNINYKQDFVDVSSFGSPVKERIPTMQWIDLTINLTCGIGEIIDGEMNLVKQVRSMIIDKNLPKREMKRSLIF